MKKVYLISGLGASGKTISAQKLSDYLKIKWLQCDNAYFLVKKYLNLTTEQLPEYPMKQTWDNPDIDWGIYKTPETLLKICYLDLLSYQLPKQIILEGESLFYNPRELKVIQDIFGDYQFRYFVMYPDYEQWLQNRSQRKQGEVKPQFLDEVDYYKTQEDFYNLYSPKGTLIIKDFNDFECSLTGGLNYQNDDVCAKKWDIFEFPKDMSDKRFFEISCNAGYYLNRAKEQRAKVYGLDINWQLLDKVYDKIPDAICYLSKIENFNWEGKSFDFILCSSAFHYYIHREEIIKNIAKHTGYFILEMPTLQTDDENILYHYFGDKQTPCAIPSEKLVLKWLHKYFKKVIKIGTTEIDGSSPRVVYKGLQ